MEKRFFNLMTIMMVAIVSVSFVSCSKDNDDGFLLDTELVNKLQGTWEFSNGTEVVMGMTITMDRSSLGQIKATMEQALGERVEFWDEILVFNGSKLNGVSYKLNGNKIILDGIDETDGIKVYVKSITSSTLVLREDISMEDLELTANMEYSRK